MMDALRCPIDPKHRFLEPNPAAQGVVCEECGFFVSGMDLIAISQGSTLDGDAILARKAREYAKRFQNNKAN